MEILGYIAAVFMGMSLGMIGGGGSILTVPILVYLFKVDPVQATAYSLFIVGMTALVGGFSYFKKNEVDLKTGFIFAIPSFIGVYLVRAFLVPNLPYEIYKWGSVNITKPILIMVVFSILMLVASISMIKKKEAKNKTKEFSIWSKIFLVSAEGLLVGAITGFVGAGGGFLIIPALVILVGMPMKIAVGTSLFIIAAKSLIGFLGDLQHQANINWSLIIILTLISLFGLFLGIRLSKNISEKTLKKGFGYFVLIMGSFIFIDQIFRL